MEQPVVITIHSVAVPVASHDFHGDETEEPVHIQHLVETLPAMRRIRINGGLDQTPQIGTVLPLVSRIGVQVLRHLLDESTVVKIAADVLEISFEERFPEPFRQHIQAQVPSIDQHRRVVCARHWNARCLEQLPANGFAKVRRILHGIVQGNLIVAMESLIWYVPGEVQGERRFVIKGTKAAGGALEVKRDLRVNSSTFTDVR